MTHDLRKKRPKAVLVGVQLPGVNATEHLGSLAELGRLCETLGFEVIAKVSQARPKLDGGTVVGAGKLQEIAFFTGGSGEVESAVVVKPTKAKLRQMEAEAEEDEDSVADAAEDDDEAFEPDTEALRGQAKIVVFDHEITATQMRNLESATGAEVFDRTGIIVEIFSRHAQTREAKLQVEIARLNYLAPRLRMSRVGGDRQGGGIGAKGAGETAHELDRRRIRDRIAELKRQLELIGQDQAQRRSRRQEALRVALVGYTNAGKSSLMRALTGSEVLVADKLFATLDTTVRAMQPDVAPRILISDTVGFIKKLPHDLVASFRSTLDEALAASLLLYVVDASDPTWNSQLAVTQEVLGEIGATDVPFRLVLNKCDQLDELTQKRLKQEYPEALMISTRRPEDVRRVREMILNHFERDMEQFEVEIPYDQSSLVGELRQQVRVVAERFTETATIFTVRGRADFISKLKRQIKS